MAKRKKRKARSVSKEPNMFWRVTGAVMLFVLGILMFLGGFGTGGSLPVNIFSGTYWAIGVAAYLAPVALFSFGFHKFTSEDKQIPIGHMAAMVSLLISSSAWLYVGFSDTADLTSKNSFGGVIGRAAGNTILAILDKFPASVVFFVLTCFTTAWAFGFSPRVFLKPFAWIFRKREKDTNLKELKSKTEDQGFKLNEGVPVEHHSQESGRLSSFKNTAQKQLAPNESHEALTVASDPDWQFPPLSLLASKQDKADPGNIKDNVQTIEETFANFSINVDMEDVNVGPRVTQYTLKPPAGIKLNRITALENNLALDLAAQSIRMEAPIPGKRAVGIEVPNLKPATVRISSVLTSKDWDEQKSSLSLVIGKDIAGSPIVASLDRMPHLLVAGQTNSGKSVMINTLLTSLLYRNSPSELKLILVDPKHVELSFYNDIPHLLTPVITEPEKCISALKWAVAEMERRYRTLAEAKKRNISEYNRSAKDASMPFIVIVVDELADLMMMAARDVEALIVRIAQKARAVGIHLVLATQRPSVDVITGLIKANIPARIAFTTTSQVDSRTIIDQVGAEKLLGMGDMLYSTAEMPKPKRVQGALITSDETQKVTDFLRMQRPPQYDEEVVSQPVQISNGRGGVVADYGANDSDDDMWRDAIKVVIDNRKASTSLLQRRLKIGYGRASRLIDMMEEQGIIGTANGAKPRDVLVSSIDDVFSDGSSDNDAFDDTSSNE
jgi:DNA segregation ATPase FtsK/SpoIIIE, S-DNA-T family